MLFTVTVRLGPGRGWWVRNNTLQRVFDIRTKQLLLFGPSVNNFSRRITEKKSKYYYY